MKYLIVLCAFCAPLHAKPSLSISPLQALRYREVLSNYNPVEGSAFFFSGTNPSAPIQFSGFIGENPSLRFYVLNPQFTRKNPIARCEITLSGWGDSRYSFNWVSPNGLMTLGQFSAEEGLPAFLLANADKNRVRLVFYGSGDRELGVSDMSAEESRKVFLALRLYRELSLKAALLG